MYKSVRITIVCLFIVGLLYAPPNEIENKDKISVTNGEAQQNVDGRVWLDATKGWVESSDSCFYPYTDSIDVGIGNQNPQGKLDVNGDFILRMTTYDVSSGLNDIDVGPYSFIRIDGATADYEITGIAGGVDGRILILYNNSDRRLRFKHESASSQAANRIINPEEGDVNIRRYGGTIFIYDATALRWRVIQFRRD